MKQDERTVFHDALRPARTSAFAPGEFVGQESFMQACDIRALARRAAIDANARVMDLCCGVAGPGRLIAAETGCRYVGVDYSASALRIAAEGTAGLGCRFIQARIPPVPREPCDVVLLLATFLAFADKRAVIEEVAGVLGTGGRFACTMLIGPRLTRTEQRAMPDADTVFPVPMSDLPAIFGAGGFDLTWQRDATCDHAGTAAALLAAYRADAEHIAGGVGTRAYSELVAAHELWVEWLGSGRVRAVELIAQRR
jgi:SAM-dependent methyltransferase